MEKTIVRTFMENYWLMGKNCIFSFLLLFILFLPNCNTENTKSKDIERNTLFYLITPPHENVPNSSTEIYQTIFSDNCKNVSSSLLEASGLNSEEFSHIDDMIFSEAYLSKALSAKSAVTMGCANLWDGAVIPYEIDPAFSNITDLYSAFATWEKQTVIRFIKKTGLHKNYIYITPSTVCSSYVGKKGGENVNLSSSCSYKNILHEIGHAIGFYHEHQRTDRDNFITINLGNILSDKVKNFDKLFPNYLFSSSYDIYSIMHYTPYAFSANTRPTITLKNESTNFGNTGILSALDLANANSLYVNNFKVINNIPVGYYR